jgi:hypothetical protein
VRNVVSVLVACLLLISIGAVLQSDGGTVVAVPVNPPIVVPVQPPLPVPIAPVTPGCDCTNGVCMVSVLGRVMPVTATDSDDGVLLIARRPMIQAGRNILSRIFPRCEARVERRMARRG